MTSFRMPWRFLASGAALGCICTAAIWVVEIRTPVGSTDFRPFGWGFMISNLPFGYAFTYGVGLLTRPLSPTAAGTAHFLAFTVLGPIANLSAIGLLAGFVWQGVKAFRTVGRRPAPPPN